MSQQRIARGSLGRRLSRLLAVIVFVVGAAIVFGMHSQPGQAADGASGKQTARLTGSSCPGSPVEPLAMPQKAVEEVGST